jgi:hypothetical protein
MRLQSACRSPLCARDAHPRPLARATTRSRHNPQFNADALASALPARGIRYDDSLHTRLGGLRKPNKHGDANAGWRSAAFRGYADYMQAPEFDAALAELLAAAAAAPTAVMCAEALPWRCHRALIGDAAAARGVAVCDIMVAANGSAKQREHKSESSCVGLRTQKCPTCIAADIAAAHPPAVTPFAVVSDDGRRVTYPAEAAAAAAAAAASPRRRAKKNDTMTTTTRRRRSGSADDRTPSIERFFPPTSPGVVTRACAKRARGGA